MRSKSNRSGLFFFTPSRFQLGAGPAIFKNPVHGWEVSGSAKKRAHLPLRPLKNSSVDVWDLQKWSELRKSVEVGYLNEDGLTLAIYDHSCPSTNTAWLVNQVSFRCSKFACSLSHDFIALYGGAHLEQIRRTTLHRHSELPMQPQQSTPPLPAARHATAASVDGLGHAGSAARIKEYF
jgi:hypothetical protein